MGGTVTWPQKHTRHQARKAAKKIFLWVTLELGLGGDRHLVTAPPPPNGGRTGLTLGGGITRGAGGNTEALCLTPAPPPPPAQVSLRNGLAPALQRAVWHSFQVLLPFFLTLHWNWGWGGPSLGDRHPPPPSQGGEDRPDIRGGDYEGGGG